MDDTNSDRSQAPRSGFDPDLHVPFVELVRDGFRQINDPHQVQLLAAVIEARRQKLAALRVLSRLREPHQTELAALVLDLDGIHQAWQEGLGQLKRLRLLSRRGPGHVRKLAAKIAKIKSELHALDRDARKLDPSISERLAPPLLRARYWMSQIELVRPGDSVEEYVARMRTWHNEGVQTSVAERSPGPFIAQQLVGHFVSFGGVKFQNARVRTARIGNAMWGWKVRISVDDHGYPDCPAVRMWLVRLRKPAQPKMRRTAKKSGR